VTFSNRRASQRGGAEWAPVAGIELRLVP